MSIAKFIGESPLMLLFIFVLVIVFLVIVVGSVIFIIIVLCDTLKQLVLPLAELFFLLGIVTIIVFEVTFVRSIVRQFGLL